MAAERVERHPFSVQPDPFRSALHADGQQEQHVPQEAEVIHVLLKGDFPADGFRVLRLIGADLPIVLAGGEARDPLALLSEGPEDILPAGVNITHGVDAHLMQLFRRFRADGIQHPDVPVDDQIHIILRGGNFKIAVGLFFLAGRFRGGFGIGHAYGTGEPLLFPGPLPDEPGEFAGPLPGARGFGYVKIGLIQRHVLGGAGEGVPDFMQLVGNRPVFFIVPVHIDPMGTEPVGFLNIHRRMHAVFPGLIAAGGDDAPLLGKGPDDQRFTPERGIIPDFDGSEKSIHIHVNNDLIRFRRLPSVFSKTPAESRRSSGRTQQSPAGPAAGLCCALPALTPQRPGFTEPCQPVSGLHSGLLFLFRDYSMPA